MTNLRFIRPCSPMPAKKPPAGEGWLHEPKMDGYRLQIAKEGRRVRLYSRGGYEWTKRLAGLAEALTAIPGRSLVLDAELCCAGADGAPDFAGLQVAMGAGRQHALSAFAFDLLHRDGVDLRPLPLVQRRHLLERLFDRAEIPGLMLVPSFNDGMKLLDAAEQHGLEGVVSKRRSSAYASGPSKTWLKVKTTAWREANRERWRLFER